MDKYTFADMLMEALSQKLDGSCQVELIDIRKNNGGIEEGFTIRTKKDAVFSMYSLTEYYRWYQSGWTIGQIVCHILLEYTMAPKHFFLPTAEELVDYGKMKDRLYLRLINRDWNRDYLEDRLFFPILDLAAVCCIDIRDSKNAKEAVQAGLSVLKEQFLRWGVSLETVFAQALHNMKQNGCYRLLRLTELLHLSEEKAIEEEAGLWAFQDISGRYSGTTALFYPELLEQAARTFGEGFYILPSSIYEVLLLPEGKGIPPEELKEIIAEANEKAGKKEESLSDVIYHYDRDTKNLCVVR